MPNEVRTHSFDFYFGIVCWAYAIRPYRRGMILCGEKDSKGSAASAEPVPELVEGLGEVPKRSGALNSLAADLAKPTKADSPKTEKT